MFLALTFHRVYANISSVMERKPRYMEPVKLVKREDSLAYAHRHDGNGDGILQSTEQPDQWQTAKRGQRGNHNDNYHIPNDVDAIKNDFDRERDEKKKRRSEIAVAIGIVATLALSATLAIGGHVANGKSAQPLPGETAIAQQDDTYWGYGGEIQAEQENAPKDRREIVHDIEQLNPDLDQPLQLGDEVKLPDYDQ